LYFLPEKLNIKGQISPEKRYRGIYEVVVYDSKLELTGKFSDLNIKQFGINPNHIHYEKAVLNIGISDLKGIEKQINIKWNDRLYPFNSGVNTSDVVTSGINAHIPININSAGTYSFSTQIDLKGSQYLYFLPVGKTTEVRLESNWSTPSFTGMYLPDNREITDQGFKSHWNILHLNRNYPQAWIDDAFKIMDSSFGTDLLIPVDNYKKSDRVAKYAILFITLTFMVFFFIEVLNGIFIHPIQYLLVGIALILFYTLLLSFSEHMKFNLSYLLSSTLTLSLVTAYSIAILKSKKIGLMIFGILVVLYQFIFAIIQLEGYALLIGSVGMFIVLSIVMYFSRKIDWYDIKTGID
jgi:inner membrane protein